MKTTRRVRDYEDEYVRSCLMAVCDYGVAILLLTGIIYSTFLNIQERYKPGNGELLAARQTIVAAQTAME